MVARINTGCNWAPSNRGNGDQADVGHHYSSGVVVLNFSNDRAKLWLWWRKPRPPKPQCGRRWSGTDRESPPATTSRTIHGAREQLTISTLDHRHRLADDGTSVDLLEPLRSGAISGDPSPAAPPPGHPSTRSVICTSRPLSSLLSTTARSSVRLMRLLTESAVCLIAISSSAFEVAKITINKASSKIYQITTAQITATTISKPTPKVLLRNTCAPDQAKISSITKVVDQEH